MRYTKALSIISRRKGGRRGEKGALLSHASVRYSTVRVNGYVTSLNRTRGFSWRLYFLSSSSISYFSTSWRTSPQVAPVLVISPTSARWRNFSRTLFTFAWAEPFRFHVEVETSLALDGEEISLGKGSPRDSLENNNDYTVFYYCTGY